MLLSGQMAKLPRQAVGLNYLCEGQSRAWRRWPCPLHPDASLRLLPLWADSPASPPGCRLFALPRRGARPAPHLLVQANAPPRAHLLGSSHQPQHHTKRGCHLRTPWEPRPSSAGLRTSPNLSPVVISRHFDILRDEPFPASQRFCFFSKDPLPISQPSPLGGK